MCASCFPFSPTCQTGSLAFIRGKHFSVFFSRYYFVIRQETRLPYDNPLPHGSKCQDNNSLFIPLLRQALLCQRALWQGVLDMPCSPQALLMLRSAKLRGQIACNRAAISLSSSVSTLDPTAGSKEGYHSPIKKVNLPSPISSACPPLQLAMSSLALIYASVLLSFFFLFLLLVALYKQLLYGKLKG